MGIGMQEASASLAELIKTVDKYGAIYGELRNLCNWLGLHCDHANVAETFKKQPPLGLQSVCHVLSF